MHVLTYLRELCIVVCNTEQSLAVVFSCKWVTVISLWKWREMRNTVCEPKSLRVVKHQYACKKKSYRWQFSYTIQLDTIFTSLKSCLFNLSTGFEGMWRARIGQFIYCNNTHLLHSLVKEREKRDRERETKRETETWKSWTIYGIFSQTWLIRHCLCAITLKTKSERTVLSEKQNQIKIWNCCWNL